MEETQIRTSATESPIQVVEKFIAALCSKDPARCAAMMTDDIVYHNVPLPPHRGRAAAERALRAMFRLPGVFDIQVLHIAERGNAVLTERIDSARGGWLDISFWVCGTFEVRDGKIASWRDYFDIGSVVLKFLTGPFRALLRSRTSPSAT